MTTNQEIALQLTIKAIEHDYIKKCTVYGGSDSNNPTGTITKNNESTAQQISEFYNNILKSISLDDCST